MPRTESIAPTPALRQRIADTIRTLSLDAVQAANSGHPGLPMGCADAATVLWTRFLRVDPAWPGWPGRDRFVLSAGHGSMLLYSLLHLSGFDLAMDELKRFRQWGSRTPGHPEHGLTPGVETTTGPLGQGLANAVGMALAERHLAERFPGHPDGAAGHRTFCIVGDGDLMEGVAAEAASLAGHWGLSRLVVWYDSNSITIDGATGLAFTEDVAARFRAYGWHVIDGVDAHDPAAVEKALDESLAETGRPSLVVGRSTIAKGSPNFAGKNKAHGAPLGEPEVRLVKERLGFDPDVKFHVPAEVAEFFAAWRAERAGESAAWKDRLARWRRDDPAAAAAWEAALAGEPPADLLAEGPAFETGAGLATRKAGHQVLQEVAKAMPWLVCGSADLFESNLTHVAGAAAVAKGAWSGRNVYYGIREHAMAAVANGLSLHGGVRPLVSTFLVFSDYLRPSLRLSALMEQPVLYVFTHDSVWVGEDGPTHEPVEHVDALRVIPGLHVIRPADARETVAAYRYAAHRRHGPTAILLTRQNLPVLARPDGPGIPAPIGMTGVVHQTAGGAPRLILVATGSEVSLCVEAAAALEAEGTRVRVVSVPCLEELADAHADAAAALLPPGIPRLFVEAGPCASFGPWRTERDGVHGIARFGASAPGAEVARHLGLSAEAVARSARALLPG